MTARFSSEAARGIDSRRDFFDLSAIFSRPRGSPASE
jgi:hypothetical protein